MAVAVLGMAEQPVTGHPEPPENLQKTSRKPPEATITIRKKAHPGPSTQRRKEDG
jgi:hypothetical protein